MINKTRNPKYIKLLHSIKSCTDYRQIENLSNLVYKYASNGSKDGADILLHFVTKKANLNPEV